MPSECDRTRLISEIADLLAAERVPDETRCAALTLIGWLARRMPGECPHALGVEEARKGCALRSSELISSQPISSQPISSQPISSEPARRRAG